MPKKKEAPPLSIADQPNEILTPFAERRLEHTQERARDVATRYVAAFSAERPAVTYRGSRYMCEGRSFASAIAAQNYSQLVLVRLILHQLGWSIEDSRAAIDPFLGVDDHELFPSNVVAQILYEPRAATNGASKVKNGGDRRE